MSKNPIINALAAAAYIFLVVSLMFYAESATQEGQSKTILMPMAFLSLFVLSAATMAYAFFYQPVMMYLDGHKADALKLLTQTLGVFAILTLLIVATAFTLR